MRKATLGSLILSVVLLAAACGSDDSDQPPDPTVTPTPLSRSAAARATVQAIELDPAPGLPGEHVNLPEIYRDERGLASYGSDGSVPSTAPHVTVDVDYAGDGNSNPPAGGPHWAGACPRDPLEAPPFCGPAPWGIYRDPWPPETLVHNIEHGGTVIWYNTQDRSIIAEIEDLVQGKLEDGDLLVVAPYPEMEAEHVAITVWARIDLIPVSEYSRDRIDAFMDAWYCQWDPEDFC